MYMRINIFYSLLISMNQDIIELNELLCGRKISPVTFMLKYGELYSLQSADMGKSFIGSLDTQNIFEVTYLATLFDEIERSKPSELYEFITLNENAFLKIAQFPFKDEEFMSCCIEIYIKSIIFLIDTIETRLIEENDILYYKILYMFLGPDVDLTAYFKYSLDTLSDYDNLIERLISIKVLFDRINNNNNNLRSSFLVNNSKLSRKLNSIFVGKISCKKGYSMEPIIFYIFRGILYKLKDHDPKQKNAYLMDFISNIASLDLIDNQHMIHELKKLCMDDFQSHLPEI